jgi:hypothetical protein
MGGVSICTAIPLTGHHVMSFSHCNVTKKRKRDFLFDVVLATFSFLIVTNFHTCQISKLKRMYTQSSRDGREVITCNKNKN